VFREPVLAISVICPNPKFSFIVFNLGGDKTGKQIYNKLKLVLIHGVDRIRDCSPFKSKPHFDLLGFANQGTSYNSPMRTIGTLHVS